MGVCEKSSCSAGDEQRVSIMHEAECKTFSIGEVASLYVREHNERPDTKAGSQAAPSQDRQGSRVGLIKLLEGAISDWRGRLRRRFEGRWTLNRMLAVASGEAPCLVGTEWSCEQMGAQAATNRREQVSCRKQTKRLKRKMLQETKRKDVNCSLESTQGQPGVDYEKEERCLKKERKQKKKKTTSRGLETCSSCCKRCLACRGVSGPVPALGEIGRAHV